MESKSSASVIRVIIADTEPIFRVGMKKIFGVEDDIRVVAQAEVAAQVSSALVKFPTDVLLFDPAISATPLEFVSEILEKHPRVKIVLSGDTTEQETVEYVRRGVSGFLNRSVSPDLLVRCLRKVAAGEAWLDSTGVNWIIKAYREQSRQKIAPDARPKLTGRELMMVAGVAQGLKNKQIAQEVGTTEQVVKNYLRRIYDKLEVSDRLELAMYCVNNNLLEGIPKPVESPKEIETEPMVMTALAGR